LTSVRPQSTALKNIGALILDCTYTEAEYPQKTGSGHGTFDRALALALAKRVGARHLYCTHHLPIRSDDELEVVLAAFLADQAGQIRGLDITLAYEGFDVTLLGGRDRCPAAAVDAAEVSSGVSLRQVPTALCMCSVLCGLFMSVVPSITGTKMGR